MTQEEKDLLIKDLCGRLPYGVKCEYKGEIYDILGIAHGRLVLCKPFMSHTLNEHPLVEEVKPYLFPLSTMTEEQKNEFIKHSSYEIHEEDCGRHKETYYYDMVGHEDKLYPNYEDIDWLNEHNFDYRGLIPMGLANDSTELNIY